jgi:Domain of unknown function (DUF3303)
VKFIVSWKLPQATYNEAIARFLKAGGLPPAGVKMIGRWHGMSGGGFAVAETNDPKALYTWQAQWADVIPLEVTPCLEDADAGEVLGSLKG